MKNHHTGACGFCTRGLLAVLALNLCYSTAALGANNITGTVRNGSRGVLATGDEVILLRLEQGLREEGRTTTDAQGEFGLSVQYPGKSYLVRVVHQGVGYEQQASVGQALSIQVFDASPHVSGLTGTIEILRTGTNGSLLHVSDMIEIMNASSPPLTQAGDRTFEVYLPANAKMDSVLAAGPGKIGMTISASPVSGEPGHVTVNFPLRPGSTKFAFNYDVPYRGHASFHPKLALTVRQLAVMIPQTMKFSSNSRAFAILPAGDNRYQVQAASQLKAGDGPEFEISGTGMLPPVPPTQASAQQRFPSPARPNPIQSPPARAIVPTLANADLRLKQAQPSSQSFVLAALTAILLAACALLVWRGRKARSFAISQTVRPSARQRRRSAA